LLDLIFGTLQSTPNSSSSSSSRCMSAYQCAAADAADGDGDVLRVFTSDSRSRPPSSSILIGPSRLGRPVALSPLRRISRLRSYRARFAICTELSRRVSGLGASSSSELLHLFPVISLIPPRASHCGRAHAGVSHSFLYRLDLVMHSRHWRCSRARAGTQSTEGRCRAWKRVWMTSMLRRRAGRVTDPGTGQVGSGLGRQRGRMVERYSRGSLGRVLGKMAVSSRGNLEARSHSWTHGRRYRTERQGGAEPWVDPTRFALSSCQQGRANQRAPVPTV
jgi:hypothetical protein